MKRTKAAVRIFLLWFCCLLPVLLFSQALKRTAVTSYNIDNGLLQNTVANMVVDKFGFVWFSTASGIQRFDGAYFETVSFNEDSTAFRSSELSVLSNEEIWVSHSKGITAFNPETNRRRSILGKAPPLPNHFYKFAGEDSNTVWYISYPEAFLQFDKKTGGLLSTIPFPSFLNPTARSIFCEPMGDTNIALWMGYSLAVFNRKEKRLSFHYTSKKFISGFTPLNANTIVYTKQGSYYGIDIRNGKEVFIRQAEDADASTSFQFFLNKDGKLFTGYGKNIYELDTASFEIKTKWAAFNQDNLINSGAISNIYSDRFDRLWIMTNSDGVKRLTLNRQPFRYYGTARREANFIRSIYVNKARGMIMAGTYGSGLLVFDTAGYLLKHIPSFGSGAATITDIIELGNDKYLLLTMGDNVFHLLNAKTGTISALYVNPTSPPSLHCSYYGKLHQLADGSFLFSDNLLYHFRLAKGKVTAMTIIRPKCSWFYVVCQTKTGGYGIASEKGIEFTDANFRQESFLPFKQPIAVRCLAHDEKGDVWMGTESGLYKISTGSRIIKKYTPADGLTDEIIYAIQPVAGGIYFSHNKGLSFLSDEAKFHHYTRYSGLQENEFNSLSSFKTADGEIYFGGINGISSFYHNTLSIEQKQPPVHITALQVMDQPWKDTAVWNIKMLEVNYDANRVALRVGVPAAADNGGYVYQYKMEGLEPEWITTSGTDFIRYVLQPGNYTFKVRINNGQESGISETRLQINVAAPFWQTVWFKILTALFAVGVIASFVQQYNRRKYLQKIKQLEMEHQLQVERERISRDLHDNLGAYASAIADNVDKVTKNPADDLRLRNLKENAAEIMNNLRDTIWALNKKEINVLTLSDRIKSFLQKMREAFPAIKIVLEEEVAANASLSPQLALNVLRIVQEALHNAIKHSRGNEISITLTISEKLYICIRDNGVGISHITNSDGNGFHNMKTRAKENNVQLEINSSDEKGTSVELFSLLQ